MRHSHPYCSYVMKTGLPELTLPVYNARALSTKIFYSDSVSSKILNKHRTSNALQNTGITQNVAIKNFP